MDGKKKGEYIGILGAFLVHVAFIALLILITFTVPHPEEEGGVPVMMGDAVAAAGHADPSLVDVDVMPEEEMPEPEPEPEPVEEPVPQEMITQTEEETVAIQPKSEPVKKETPRPKEVKKPEKTAAEKAAEAKRLAEEKAERERKAAEEAARKRVAGAFGKGAQMTGSKGTSSEGKGTEGSKDGNVSSGAAAGVGGYGTFDLNGRSIGAGGLPRPVYNVQEEGKVVVAITVNPAGEVIATSIHRQTNTVNSALRKAAEDAAKKARFNAVEGVSNQTGTITYYFKLK